MLTSLFGLLSTSYIAWYFQTYELAAVYPFDTTYATPSEAGAPKLVETSHETPDGAKLVVWKAAASAGRPTVLYLPGNAGALKDRADRLATLIDRGYGVVAPAYRGSSGSTGTPEEALLVADALELADNIPGPLVLYGESLGAAIAIRLAAEGVGDALVLEAPFTSLSDLVAVQFPMEDVSGFLTQRWDNLGTVDAVEQPMLVIHGEADRIVPFKMGLDIYNAAGSREKALLAVADHGHTSLWNDQIRDTLFTFLTRDF